MGKNLFFEEETSEALWYKFKNSRWGRLYDTIPWHELEARLPAITHGPSPYFNRKGKFALMPLKRELGVWDEALIEHINTAPRWRMNVYNCFVTRG